MVAFMLAEKLVEFTGSQGIDLSQSTLKEFSALMQKDVSGSSPTFETMNELGRLLDLPGGILAFFFK